MKNPYRSLLNRLLALQTRGRTLPLGGLAAPRRRAPAARAPRVLVFSPHPDDECIIGGLALRLQRECRWRVVNVAVTQGSRKDRQAARWKELADACAYLGFDLVATGPHGLEGVNRETREREPARWAAMVETIAALLREQRPRAILVPHDADWNSTHIGTHLLVLDALAACPQLRCFVVETEFWGAMATPNLMVEIPPRDLADLMAALSFHVGEVQRNPYHLTLPAWMQDNVRRGGEVVGGQGGAAPDFAFATLYRLRAWNGQALVPVHEGGKLIGAGDDLAALFKE
ncbi:MAG TPA: PIG-L family deacetylase [Kiritimatiellia bacterium]|nr:PIG-L family deacetylase [Kiritimatiellia bacterium]